MILYNRWVTNINRNIHRLIWGDHINRRGYLKSIVILMISIHLQTYKEINTINQDTKQYKISNHQYSSSYIHYDIGSVRSVESIVFV